MKKVRLFAATIVIGLSVVVFGPPSWASNPGVAPIDSHPFGLTYPQWAARWWQWDFSIPLGVSPVANDTTGAQCAINQSGPVWFLAGTPGGSVTRSCKIPNGLGIFFPIANIINDYPCPESPGNPFEPGPNQSLEDFLTKGAKDIIGQVKATDLEVEVDGVSLTNLGDFRATSKLFGFTAARDIGTGVDALKLGAVDACVTGSPQLGVADGYWIMLNPLSVGDHTLHFKATATVISTEATYNLTILPNK